MSKVKRSFAHSSGMRGNESSPALGEEKEMPGAAPATPAFASGMRAGDKPAGVDPQASAQEVAQGLQPGTNLEGIAQGVEPPTIEDKGDHYLVTHKVAKPKKV